MRKLGRPTLEHSVGAAATLETSWEGHEGVLTALEGRGARLDNTLHPDLTDLIIQVGLMGLMGLTDLILQVGLMRVRACQCQRQRRVAGSVAGDCRAFCFRAPRARCTR